MSLVDDVRTLPQRASRSLLIGLSHRRGLARLAVRTPLTRPVVGRFVAGQTLAEALDAIERLQAVGLLSTVDVLGESVTSAGLAEAAVAAYVDTYRSLATRGLSRHASVKLTQMGLDIDETLCRANLDRVIDAARSVDGFLRIDMEDHLRTEATLAIWREARGRYPQTGIVIQAALRRSAADVERIIAEGGRVRLCKGAYDEPPSVAFVDRREVDASFARLMERLLLAGEYPAIATHDPRLVARAIAIAEREAIPADRFEFQMLYGIRRDLQRQLVGRGYTVRIYVPYGEQWYPYFMRRLAERPQNVAFLLGSFVEEEARRLRRRRRAGEGRPD